MGFRLFISIFSFLFLFGNQSLFSDCCGKIDFGPTFVHVDVLQSGHTIERLDLYGVKADMNYEIWKGICLKPTFLYAKNFGKICSGGLGLGQYLPVNEKFCLLPSFGCLLSELSTYIDIREFGLTHVREKFRSISPYLACEITYKICPKWRISGLYQYSWSRTRTKIGNFPTDKSHAQGSNYSMMVERDINDNCSLNLGAAYNMSLSKEKHGIRGYGVRLGFGYWF